jgi:hypothetical protein
MRCITAGAQIPLRDEIKVQGASMKTGLSGKVVLITGAMRNHGRASAFAFPPGPQDPLTQSGKPEEIGCLAVAPASEEAGYVTGQCVVGNEWRSPFRLSNRRC